MDKKTVLKHFKLAGLSLSADATEELCSLLQYEDQDDVQGKFQDILNAVKELVERREIKTSLIEKNTILNIIGDLSADNEDITKQRLSLIDAFDRYFFHHYFIFIPFIITYILFTTLLAINFLEYCLMRKQKVIV